MSGRLISIPSLKYKRKKRPNRTLSQQAPLANYDEFQLSDVSDSEENSNQNNHPISAPISKLQHFHSSDDAHSMSCLNNSGKTNLISNNFDTDNIDESSERFNENDNHIDQINESVNIAMEEQQDSASIDENIVLEVNNEENLIQKNILEDNDAIKKLYEEESDENKENLLHTENCILEEQNSEADTNDKLEKDDDEDDDENECEKEEVIDNDCEEKYDENERISDESDNEKQNKLSTEDQNNDLDKIVVSEYSGIATEPNTPNDQSMEECSQKADENVIEEETGGYQREEYYDYVEEPIIDGGDDPFSLEYQQSKGTHYQPYSDNSEPPQIVITEPSDQDLPNLDGSKITKPSRPPEPPKNPKVPKRPPPPSDVINKKVETVLPTIPPPPSSTKRRNRKNDDDFLLDRKTKFPFKTHFEKRPLVPNPKKAILNVLKGESKKERRRRKAEEEFEKILNTVDPEEAPLCDSTDEWKAYKEFQDRILASVQKSQEKIKSLIEEENTEEDQNLKPEEKQEDENQEKTNTTIVDSDINQDWAFFEEKNHKLISEKLVEFEDFGMSTISENKLKEVDIWGCDNEEIAEEDTMNFDKDETTFVETFNQRIEETEDDFFDKSPFDSNANNDENMFSVFNEEFEIDKETINQEIKPESTVTFEPEISRRERPKPQRQETLSGNNPFRKASLNSDDEIKPEIEKDEESPFITALKAVGITNLDETAPGFDPLTTIYPDSGDEKPSSHDDDDLSSQSSNDNFQPFKITTKITIIDPVISNDEPVKPLPSPNVSATRGPRERKLPPEAKPYCKTDKTLDADEFFAEIRSDNNNKNLLEIDEEQNVIRFESPLSGKFSGEKVEWEAFPTNSVIATEEEAVWGENIEFKPDFEPLPGEIVTFEPFHPKNENLEWKLLIRQPEKKSKAKQISRYTSNRWWKETYLKLATEKDRPCLRFYDNLEDSEPYRVVRLEPYMQLSRDKLQQYDKYGKLHIFKVNHVVYKEMVGMRTEKFSFKTLQNLVSHKPKMNMVLDHMPLRTEIVKIGSLDQKPLRSLMTAIEDSMMSITSHRDASLEYTKEEVCCYVNDEYECLLNENGSILSQKARTRILFAAFVIGNPHIVLGINDKWRFGNEIVRRQDIIPIMHDDWINIYEPEFHSCIDMVEYEKDHMIKFFPLDGCKFELMRFRVPLRPNRELPLSADVKFKINGVRIDIRVDLSVPGFFSASKRHGAVHCDDIEIRVPIPEEWAYHFRIEKHMKYGSMHSALRKPGKIKGFERITQIAQSFLPPSMLEASAGVAKYEHLYRAIVWRIPRLPEKNEASYKPHMMTCKFILAPHDNVPPLDEMIKTFLVEFSMPASTVSGATVRSISVEHTTTPERFVKYLASFKYKRDILYELGEVKPAPIVSILDQTSEPVEETHSSDESHQEKSSPSETTNSPPKSQKNDSIDLLECNSDQNLPSAQYHSAYDDLLTLDCFSKDSQNIDSQAGTGMIISGNLMDDIAMVDDEHE